MSGRVRYAGAEQLRENTSRRAAEDRRDAHHAAGNVDATWKLSARRRDCGAQDRRPSPQGGSVCFQESLVAGKGQRAGSLFQHLRGKAVFEREKCTLARPIAARVF